MKTHEKFITIRNGWTELAPEIQVGGNSQVFKKEISSLFKEGTDIQTLVGPYLGKTLRFDLAPLYGYYDIASMTPMSHFLDHVDSKITKHNLGFLALQFHEDGDTCTFGVGVREDITEIKFFTLLIADGEGDTIKFSLAKAQYIASAYWDMGQLNVDTRIRFKTIKDDIGILDKITNEREEDKLAEGVLKTSLFLTLDWSSMLYDRYESLHGGILENNTYGMMEPFYEFPHITEYRLYFFNNLDSMVQLLKKNYYKTLNHPLRQHTSILDSQYLQDFVKLYLDDYPECFS